MTCKGSTCTLPETKNDQGPSGGRVGFVCVRAYKCCTCTWLAQRRGPRVIKIHQVEEWGSISQEDLGITLHQHHHYPRITHSLDERDVVLSRADIGIIFALQVFLILRLRHISQTAEIRKPQGQINNQIFVMNVLTSRAM